jgi:hypothetical protein
MKISDCGVDDAFLEFRFVMEQDGSTIARALLKMFGYIYRTFHWSMLVTLRLWNRSHCTLEGGR